MKCFDMTNMKYEMCSLSLVRYVGCGYMMTGGYPGLPGLDTQYYVCNYGPAGNYYGQEVYREISNILIGSL